MLRNSLVLTSLTSAVDGRSSNALTSFSLCVSMVSLYLHISLCCTCGILQLQFTHGDIEEKCSNARAVFDITRDDDEYILQLEPKCKSRKPQALTFSQLTPTARATPFPYPETFRRR